MAMYGLGLGLENYQPQNFSIGSCNRHGQPVEIQSRIETLECYGIIMLLLINGVMGLLFLFKFKL